MVFNADFKDAVHWILSDMFTFHDDGFQRNVPTETSQTLSQGFVAANTPLFVFVDPFGYNGILNHIKYVMQKFIPTCIICMQK